MTIKEARISKGLTQKEASLIVGIPLRTYQNYEYGETSLSSFTGRAIIKTLAEYERYTKDKGILPIELIVKDSKDIFPKHKVDFAYLFGSYAKGKPNEKSDIDFLIGGEITGIDFFALQNELSEALHKNIDLLKIEDIKENSKFLNEVFSTGVKIYGK
jgi:predicted nucleotidyltransferase